MNENNCSRDIGSFDSFRSKFFAKFFHVLTHFNEMNMICELFQVFFLMKIFDLRVKELK